jgi:hypothetical protein
MQKIRVTKERNSSVLELFLGSTGSGSEAAAFARHRIFGQLSPLGAAGWGTTIWVVRHWLYLSPCDYGTVLYGVFMVIGWVLPG